VSKSRRAPLEPRDLVGLVEQADVHPRPQPPVTGRLDGGVAAEHPQEVRLAAAVGPEHRDPVTGVHLDVERLGQTDQLQPLDLQHPLARGRAGEVHPDGPLGGRGLGWAGLHEPLPPRLGCVGARRVAVVDRRPHLHQLVVVEEAPFLLLPPAPRRGQVGVAGGAGLVEAREPARVHPRARSLEHDDHVGRGGEQLAVVADEQDGLGRRGDLLLEPALGRQVEEVVGLVEQQDVDVGGEQRLEHQPLALAARQLGDRTVAGLVEGLAEHPLAARVPPGLLVVAADLAPHPDGLGQGDAGGLRRLRVVGPLGGDQRGGRGRETGRAEPAEELADRAAAGPDADGLGHQLHRRVDRDRALGRALGPHDELQQGGLAGAVGADQGGVTAVPDPEGDVVEELAAPRVGVGHPVDVDHGHRLIMDAADRRGNRIGDRAVRR
jgi:hypothetical protein